jgi:hypothetical protein
MAEQRNLDRRAKKAAFESVVRMKRRRPVDILDMELFFGRPLRCKAVINHLRRTYTCDEESTDDEERTDEEEEIYWEAPTIRERLPFKPRKMSVGGDLNLPHEVLEAILSHLPTLDLIVATGVNKTFRTIVKNSPTLQRNLFFRPTNKPREFVKVEDGYKFAVATQKEFDGPVEDDDIEYYYNHGGSNAPPRVLAYEVAALCPLLVPEYDDGEQGSVPFGYREPRLVYFSRLAPLAEHWANMYLTNPPTTEVDIHLNYTGGYARQYNISARLRVHCETGVTITSLLDAIYLEDFFEVPRKPGW